MRLTRDALRWAPKRMIRKVAGRYAGVSSDLERTMDDAYLDDLREMYGAAGFPDAYLSTIRSLINPRALLGGHHDVTRRLNELKLRPNGFPRAAASTVMPSPEVTSGSAASF